MLSRTVGFALGLAVAFSLAASPARAQALPPQDLSVMLTFKDAAGADVDECAAGIVVAQSAARTLVLTAHHVLGLEPGQVDNGRTIQVEFRSRRGQRLPARVLAGAAFQDRALDYLLIAVDGDAPTVSRDAFFALRGQVDQPVSAVRTVGFQDCRPWDPDPSFHPVTSAGRFEIEFESSVSGGASGGALFDQADRLVALVIDSDGRRARARPLSLILDRLRQNGVALDLRIAAGEGAANASEPPSGEQPVARDAPVINPDRFTASLQSVYEDQTTLLMHPPAALRGRIERYDASMTGFREQNGTDDYVVVLRTGAIPRISPPVTIVFRDGTRSRPFVLPLKAFHDAEVARTFASHEWLRCERYATVVCRSSAIPLYPLVRSLRLGTSPSDLPLALKCEVGCAPADGGPAYLVRSADFAASSAHVFVDVELDGGVHLKHEQVIVDKRRCEALACAPETLAAGREGAAPPAMVSADGASYRLVLPDAFDPAAMEIDPDGAGFLPAPGGSIAWGHPRVSVRYRTGGRTIGPFPYSVPEADLVRASLPRPPARDLIRCVRGSCWLKEPIWIPSIRSMRLGGAPDRLRPMPLPDLRTKALDGAYRARLAGCGALWNEGCEALRNQLGMVFVPAAGQTDVYYELELYDGTRSEVIRQRLDP